MEKGRASGTSSAAYPTSDIQREKGKLPLQLLGHLSPESHLKSRWGEDPCSCSQHLLCQKASMCLARSRQVEGQVNRLKVFKRQGYGRASPVLLQARLVGASNLYCQSA